MKDGTISLDDEKTSIVNNSNSCKQESIEKPPASSSVATDTFKTVSSDKKINCDDMKCSSSLVSEADSCDDVPLARKRKLTRIRRKRETVEIQKSSNRKRTKAPKSEGNSEIEDVGHDEIIENDVTIEKHQQNNTELETSCSEDELDFKNTMERRRRRSSKVAEKLRTKRKRGPRKKLFEKLKPAPTLHDYKCYICNSDSLGSRKAMIEHFSVHVDKVPYTCQECVMETVVLTRVRTLNTHMKMHAQPVKCDYCDRRYSNAAGKYYHTQTFHLGGGAPCLVNCEVCGKTCGSQMALKQHMKYHTTKLKCSKCDMVFNHPNKRRNHERTHDENRGYECVVCKKVSLQWNSFLQCRPNDATLFIRFFKPSNHMTCT